VRAIHVLVTVAVAATAVACGGDEPPSTDHRPDLLEQAFALRRQDPNRAAELFADAGRGAVLERARLEAWLEALELGDATADQWRVLLEDLPPDDLAVRARLALADALIDGGEISEAVALLEGVPDEARLDADEILLTLEDGPLRESAARRLAVLAPRRLRRVAPDLEDRVVVDLTVDQWLERATRWSDAGWPRTAATDPRGQRWQGEAERRRRLAAARAELEAGSSRAVTSGGGDDELQVAGLRLVLECGTEGGDLERAVAAWWRLEAVGWQGERRGWLGRRLGVAVAQRGGAVDVVHDLAGALPNHERCLRFWQAWTANGGDEQLQQLSEVSPADIYGIWARQSFGLTPPAAVELAPAAVPSPPPASVQWLTDHDAAGLAMREWRRIVAARGVTPQESLAAAEMTSAMGDHNDSIRWLRAAFPELGGVEMWRAPSNAVRSYLPLPWHRELTAAAREAGIDPWLLAAVGRQESAMTAHARSPRGAIGVLQLLPDTASMHARALGFEGAPDLYDPPVNLRLGAHELARLLERFGAVEPALAAYNGGETRVRRWWRRWSDERRFTEAIPIPETYNYVRRVRFLSEAYRLVYDDVWRRAQ
jgi:soluble lytic murein transglycosylase